MFQFAIGQIVEMVYGQKEKDYTVGILRRWIGDESAVKKFMDDHHRNEDGDLYKVCERSIKKDNKNVEHDLYLCQSLKSGEFTLFGRSGLREHSSKEE